MPKYTVFADVVDNDLQNVHEWATTWGEINNEIEEFGGEILGGYAILGDHDFQFIYEADDGEAAIKIAMAIERYGLDTETSQVIDIDRLGELAEDI
jgi:uncharacterized protein with GYD domain